MELSLDRMKAALAKARAEVHRADQSLAKAQATLDQAKEVALRAKSTWDIATAQREDATSALAAIDARYRTTDPNDADAIRWLASEREQTRGRGMALDGAVERAQSEHAKARTDLDTARAAVAHAEEAQRFAQEKCEEADRNHQEAQLVAAGDPSALARKADSDRARAVLDEHLRLVRSHGAFSPGGGPCEVALEAEKVRTRLFNRQALDANEIGWGTHAEGAGRNVSPVGFRGPAPEQMQEGSKPYNTQDPLRNE